MNTFWLRCIALCALTPLAHAAPVYDQWAGTGPFASGLGNRVITSLAVRPNGAQVFAGTGSGTVLGYAFSNTTPGAFSFMPQTGVPLSTAITSNSITVAGITNGVAISVTGGLYAINGGAYTAAAGNVNNGDTVTVRLTSAASFSTTSLATLTIASMSAVFQVTTLAAVTTYSAPAGSGSGNITASFTGGGPDCSLATSSYAAATTTPDKVSLPYGTFSFTTTQCNAGATLNFTITYPQALPAGAKYYKYGPEFGGSSTPHWYALPGAVVSGNQVTFSITDNGVGDSNPAAGYITDPGGVGVPLAGAVGIPALSEWALMLLAGLMATLGLRQSQSGTQRRKPRLLAP
ncbi:MAG: IPTL-CTERM sorting domain-containing protein [Acidovorax sp.]|uniref:IPTL-CTERM sorting domain-containing protein n=1 Tax=Acidovorax sp. TaxID=1872122 RepID=UPI0025C5DE8B|nr:IPTL-CTERM sorting domain-containing protein [Acidovorax sp.]MCE1191325.1 IPTL-CTERM sorting domain-containing protein [Acidovorax sp.]